MYTCMHKNNLYDRVKIYLTDPPIMCMYYKNLQEKFNTAQHVLEIWIKVNKTWNLHFEDTWRSSSEQKCTSQGK